MSDVISIVSTPDRAAQKLWERASGSSQRVANLLENIPWQTVSGERSPPELTEAADLHRAGRIDSGTHSGARRVEIHATRA